jgi:hypothetical protein
MAPAGFKPAIPASDRPQNQNLHGAATGLSTANVSTTNNNNNKDDDDNNNNNKLQNNSHPPPQWPVIRVGKYRNILEGEGAGNTSKGDVKCRNVLVGKLRSM